MRRARTQSERTSIPPIGGVIETAKRVWRRPSGLRSHGYSRAPQRDLWPGRSDLAATFPQEREGVGERRVL